MPASRGHVECLRITFVAPGGNQFSNRVLLNLLEHLRYAGVADYKFERSPEFGKGRTFFSEGDTLVVEFDKPHHVESEHWADMVIERGKSFLDKIERFERVKNKADR